MTCTCGKTPDAEHMVTCPYYEPPLTQAEIRSLRRHIRTLTDVDD